MNTVLNWKKGLFSCNYKLLDNGQQIGNLKDKSFKRTAVGELNGKKYEFRTRGLLNIKTDIIDTGTGKLVGNISFNCWSPEAKIQIGDEVSYCGYTNMLQNKWGVFSSDKAPISYRGWACQGSVEMQEQEEIKVLAGLYISNYFWEMVGVLGGVFMPSMFFLF